MTRNTTEIGDNQSVLYDVACWMLFEWTDHWHKISPNSVILTHSIILKNQEVPG